MKDLNKSDLLAAERLAKVFLPQPAMELLGRFMIELGVGSDAAPEVITGAIDARLQAMKSPLLDALLRFFREESAQGGDGAVGRAFAAFAGAAGANGVLDSGARPAGTVPAGPLARFVVGTSDPKKR